MPTQRAFVFLILALALYLLANQTQVGWIYIMTNGLVGLLAIAFFYAWGMLKPLHIQRVFQPLSTQRTASSLASYQDQEGDPELRPIDFYEDDPIEISLYIKHTGLKPALLISGQEICPFAPPAEQIQPFFVSSLFRGQAVKLAYRTVCYRRGPYHFSTLSLASKGPFGFFGSQRTLAAPGDILIYPYYHPLKRLRLLETKGFTDRLATRPGLGDEVIGAREYRSGDSMRQIHWRSTARAGKFVVKEFSDHDQVTMTVVLDLSVGGNVGEGKFSTFETALRIAASLGYYASQKKIPFYLAGQSQRWKPPAVALSWWSSLNYLARVENDGQKPLADILSTFPPVPFLVALIANPDEPTQRALSSLQQKGIQTLAIFITPDGTTPLSALASSGDRLIVRSVSPHNWAEVLDAV
jgi:uncharacterized protein (DUF58 family)